MKKYPIKIPITWILLISFISLLIGLGAIRYIEYRDIHKSSKTLDKLTGKFEERQYQLSRLTECFVFGRINLETMLFRTHPRDYDKAEKDIEQYTKKAREIINEYKVLITDSTEQKLYDSLVLVYNAIIRRGKVTVNLIRQGDIAAARATDSWEIQPLYAALQNLSFKLADYVKERDFQQGDKLIDKLTGSVGFARTMTYVLAILMLVLGTFIVFAIRVIIKNNHQLIKSEKKYRDFVEQTHEIINRIDANGNILFYNNKFKELLEYSDEELSQLTIFDLLTDDYAAIARKGFQNPEKNKLKLHTKGVLKSKSGKLVHYEGDIIWEFHKGKFEGATAFLNDVTEKTLLQNSLRQSEQRFRQLFDMAPVPMFTVEPGTLRFTLVNNAFLRHYGYSREEFLEKTLMEIRPQEEIPRTASAIDLIIEENWDYNDYHKHIKKDGSVMEVETFAARIMMDNKPYVLTAVIDITERKLNENKITQAIIKTQEDERYEIGGELHDNVGQILAAAKMSLGMMKQELPQSLSEIYQQTLQSVDLATDEIRNLSHRLAPVFFREGSLKVSFERLLNTFNLEEKYKVSFFFDNAVEEYPLSLELQLNLYRICQEGLRNIIKYSEATEIKLELILHQENLCMLLSDNGIGFEPKKVSASGIGLANMKRRTELFSGRLDIYSSPGNGCEIMVTIPLG